MHTGETPKITSLVLVFIMCAMEKVLCTTYRVNYPGIFPFFTPSVGCKSHGRWLHSCTYADAQSETGMQLLCMLCSIYKNVDRGIQLSVAYNVLYSLYWVDV